MFIGKVLFIEIVDYEKLNDYANNLWSGNLSIMPNRGSISTSDGNIIADNFMIVSLFLIYKGINIFVILFFMFLFYNAFCFDFCCNVVRKGLILC